MAECYVVMAGSMSEPIFHSKDGWVSIEFRDVYVWNSLNLAQGCVRELTERLKEPVRSLSNWRVERLSDIQEWYE